MTSIEAAELRIMLKRVAPHMSDDDCVPVINSVRLEARDGYLFAVATDRYTIAVARTAIPGSDEAWEAPVPADELPAVTAWLKPQTGAITISVTDEDGLKTIVLSGEMGSLLITITTADYRNFVSWRTIMRGQMTADMDRVPLSGFTTSYLARWKHAGDVLHTWQAAPKKPLVLASGDGRFLGMQMPVNRDQVDRADLVNQWLPLLTPIAYVDGQSYRLDVQWADKDGDPWEYSGQDRYGEPLMQVVGIEDDRHTLARLIEQYGPIRPLPAEEGV